MFYWFSKSQSTLIHPHCKKKMNGKQWGMWFWIAPEDVQSVISTPKSFCFLAWTFVHFSREFHAHRSRIDWFTDRHVQVLLTWSSKWIEAYGPFARGIVEPAHVGLWISHSWTDEHETHWKGVHRSKLEHRDFWCGYDLLDFFRSHKNTHNLSLSTLFLQWGWNDFLKWSELS